MSKVLSKPFDYENDLVECNLCHRYMKYYEYDKHYEACLDIAYLEGIAKQKGEAFTRKDLENCRREVIDKLLAKYPPEPISLEIFT